jgi:16S rRNA (cytosine967-C5)-methyltransferase
MKAREYAYSILDRVVNHGGYASLLMRRPPQDLSASDQALAAEIVYGTLRNWDYLQYQWQDLAAHARQEVQVILGMSIYQLLFMDRVPAYAVLDEAVDLSPREARGFVNALLRRVAARGKREIKESDPLKRCALETSHPLWILKLWASHYGEENALRIAAKDQQRPVVYGRVNTLKASHDQLAADPRVHFVEAECFTYDGVLTRSLWFQEGKVVVQDRASQRIPYLLKVSRGMRVLDACSAPGTKAQQIACLMEDQGSILAGDVAGNRLELIRRLMEKTNTHCVHAVRRDAAAEDTTGVLYDRILVDAPCSGLGDLCHKPEIRLHVRPGDLDELIQLQKNILQKQAGLLAPGGLLVYSTCTLNRKENEGQVQNFLAEHPEYSLLEDHTFLPFELNSDGFYGAVLRRADEGEIT